MYLKLNIIRQKIDKIRYKSGFQIKKNKKINLKFTKRKT